MANQTNDPKYQTAAHAIARAFRSKALSWRLQDDDETLVVVLASGPKVHGTAGGAPDPTLLAELVKLEPVRDIEPTDTSNADGALADPPRSAGGGSRRSKNKAAPPEDSAVG
jgi:hypothetical protein